MKHSEFPPKPKPPRRVDYIDLFDDDETTRKVGAKLPILGNISPALAGEGKSPVDIAQAAEGKTQQR